MKSIPNVLKEGIPDAVKEHVPMIVAHFSHYELTKLDQMQNGTSIDEATGLREYSKLGELIRIPQYRKAIKSIAQDVKKHHPLPEVVEKSSKDVILNPKRFTPNPVDSVPEIKHIEEEGEGEDDELAMIPITVADFLDDIAGIDPQINPHTGLRQYFFQFLPLLIPSILSAAAPTALSIAAKVGIGAAVGAATSHFQGGKPLKGALMGGAGAGIGHYAGDMLGGIGSSIGSALGGIGGGGSPGGAIGQAAGISPNTANGVKAASQAASPGFMSSMFNPENLLPLAAIGGLYYKGHNDSKRLAEEAERKNREARANLQNYYGMNKGLGDIKPFDPVHTPDFRTTREKEGDSSEHRYFQKAPGQYKTGGTVLDQRAPNVRDEVTPGKTFLLKGPGKGQDDTIKTQCLPGDFIVDASSTSNLGDGSTDSGYKEILRFVRQVEKAKGGEVRANQIDYSALKRHKVPVALSNEEVKIDTSITTMLGNGNYVKGGKLLQKAINNLRYHKTKNRTTIPPKAKPLVAYFPEKFRKELNLREG